MNPSKTHSIAFINPRLGSANVGDLFIEDSIKKILRYDAAASIDIDPRHALTGADIAAINSCEVALILGTNLWYRSLSRPGRWQITRADIDKLKIPIIPFGMGTTRHRGDDNGFDAASLEILKALHERCREASVRDLRTQEALAENGIQNVRMTACPTLFRSLRSRWRLTAGYASNQMIVTPRKGQRRNLFRLVSELNRRGWECEIAGQVTQDRYYAHRHFPYRNPALPVLHQFRLDPYLHRVCNSYGAIGWRLHGNLLHLAAGKPVSFFANCSRVESFCDACRLPCVYAEDGEVIPEKALNRMIDQLSEPATFDKFAERYAHYYRETVAFLTANQLSHNLELKRGQVLT